MPFIPIIIVAVVGLVVARKMHQLRKRDADIITKWERIDEAQEAELRG